MSSLALPSVDTPLTFGVQPLQGGLRRKLGIWVFYILWLVWGFFGGWGVFILFYF